MQSLVFTGDAKKDMNKNGINGFPYEYDINIRRTLGVCRNTVGTLCISISASKRIGTFFSSMFLGLREGRFPIISDLSCSCVCLCHS